MRLSTQTIFMLLFSGMLAEQEGGVTVGMTSKSTAASAAALLACPGNWLVWQLGSPRYDCLKGRHANFSRCDIRRKSASHIQADILFRRRKCGRGEIF